MKRSMPEVHMFCPHSARYISDHFIQSYFQYLHKFQVV